MRQSLLESGAGGRHGAPGEVDRAEVAVDLGLSERVPGRPVEGERRVRACAAAA
ncbi:hypothetical protein F4553_001892 [Allocatelliglobosispora scoriae]|uniref:Uncharacterized protein n=1 Tax=Allocatelliglobosispora scoriae TaxID=643052 RepID=A0A841BNH9_9ACTN|nr:hypothetical protein [Allocatelliglobosispora scoriae]MBB5868513.1 hypothetical protein [Allocatelliglobosispora scoriae]